MKYYYLSLISIVSAFIIFSSVPARTQVCQSKEQFIKSVEHLKPTVFVANKKAVAAFSLILNESTGKDNEVDEMWAGLFSVSGMMHVGIVFFNKGCTVKGSTAVMTSHEWVGVLNRLRLTADDFEKLEGA